MGICSDDGWWHGVRARVLSDRVLFLPSVKAGWEWWKTVLQMVTRLILKFMGNQIIWAHYVLLLPDKFEYRHMTSVALNRSRYRGVSRLTFSYFSQLTMFNISCNLSPKAKLTWNIRPKPILYQVARKLFSDTLTLNHAIFRFSRWQTDDIFLIFPRK